MGLPEPFTHVPWTPLIDRPTPLQEAPRLRAALGGPSRCPRIFLKRDDVTSLATGGNKARKLEFTVGQALAAGATVLLTTGAVQSNHARATAAAARAAGLRAVLVLTAESPVPELSGNLLLDVLLGAEVHVVPPAPDGSDDNPHERARLAASDEELRAAGELPLLVPVGASDAIGTTGYALAAHELQQQLAARRIEAHRVYVAAGSRGTQAGLTLGAAMMAATWAVHGVAVSPGDPMKTAKAAAMANACAERLGIAPRVTEGDFITHQDYYGDGYAIPTAACQEAIRLVAHTEGVLLEPVYTGKAMAGLIDHIRRGSIAPDETVVFIHTGGTAALFALRDQLGPLPRLGERRMRAPVTD